MQNAKLTATNVANDTVPATYASTAVTHKYAAEFGPSSGKNNVPFKKHPNYAKLRETYIARFDSFNERLIDTLTRNELAAIRCVSNGSIKTAQIGNGDINNPKGKCAYDILANTATIHTAPAITFDAAKAFIAGLSEEQRKALLAGVGSIPMPPAM